ncbi:YbhB/YbcL family Raf kinase inhibitor-like protein [Aeromonas cavernicola]|uniref:YbhB/YbcL family Raf kinase inhibitor-like protein n=1 Tax=Aeromonas cavernicola TaxID=1006623 RepID=A0A2H9U961_9GAMM|nr:YbhB/YbcL family Raf kinase inhibitor-like protein [Aeromonas cavernicola]PJG60580.1 YbhB/YbcL family Raf kinase inhibitor-like protein [Aeromonas cavernicola]
MTLTKSISLLSVLCLSALPAAAMSLSSTDIQEGQLMDKAFSFNGFGCKGDNRSPQLSWQGLPAGTKSIAITAYDPDAPTGSGWWHWLVVNLPVSQSELASNASGHLKQGIELRTDFGTQGYGGPCPPAGHGMHRYQFTAWALPEAKLEVTAETPPAMVGYMLNSMALGNATLTATFVTP